MIRNLLILLISITVLFSVVYLSDVVHGWASTQAGDDNNSASDDTDVDRFVENVAFGLGEKLSFDIGYGFINAGYATLEVADLIEYNNRPCYLIVSTANSNKFFSSFYRVEDRVESIIDATGIFSWHFEKTLREGKYRAVKSYSFDQINHKVFYEGDTIDVAHYIHDALSVMYFVRTQELKIGESIYADNFTDGKHYPLEVKIIKRETVDVEAGKFDCIVVEPLLMSSGIFKHEGRLKVWLTDDRLKLPVLMKSKVLVGSITAELTEYELGEILDF
jgi:hypothetical protein